MKRSIAREKVFKIIFQMEFHDDFQEIYQQLIQDEELKGVQGKYAEETIKGIMEQKQTIDDAIKRYLTGWTIGRLPKAVLAILRLGTYEVKYNEDIPDISAIDEAVKLAHQYCDEKDSVFINGILNSIYKEGNPE